jgi:prophage DNA circulation protein
MAVAAAVRSFFAGIGLADASGSFRGARFRVDSYQTETGRRADVREYPLRNIPNAEDLGRKARRFSFTAYVVGPFWEIQRDRLLNACEEDGPGRLVHPFHGEHRVVCESCTVSETRASGMRYAAFELQFVEAGDYSSPEAAPNSAFELLAQAAAALARIVEVF